MEREAQFGGSRGESKACFQSKTNMAAAAGSSGDSLILKGFFLLCASKGSLLATVRSS